jgi:hypothetical protein
MSGGSISRDDRERILYNFIKKNYKLRDFEHALKRKSEYLEFYFKETKSKFKDGNPLEEYNKFLKYQQDCVKVLSDQRLSFLIILLVDIEEDRIEHFDKEHTLMPISGFILLEGNYVTF